MKRSLRILILLVLVPLIDIAGTAQEPDARTILQAALKAMGGENLRSIQYSGNEGYVAAVGQAYNPASDWPAPWITTYTRTIDYEARSSREEYGLTTRPPARAGRSAAATRRSSPRRSSASSGGTGTSVKTSPGTSTAPTSSRSRRSPSRGSSRSG